MYKGRLVITADSQLILTILHTYHDSVLGGHSRFPRTYKRLTSEVYKQGMKGTVKRYVEEYGTCQ